MLQNTRYGSRAFSSFCDIKPVSSQCGSQTSFYFFTKRSLVAVPCNFIIMCPPPPFLPQPEGFIYNISCIDFLLERKLAWWHLGCSHTWTCWFVPNQSACFPLWVILCSHCIMVKWAKAHTPSRIFLTSPPPCTFWVRVSVMTTTTTAATKWVTS